LSLVCRCIWQNASDSAASLKLKAQAAVLNRTFNDVVEMVVLSGRSVSQYRACTVEHQFEVEA